MTRALLLPIFLLLAVPTVAQTSGPGTAEDHYTLWTSGGESVSMEEIVQRMAAVDVVFLGEEHDDSIAHVLQRRLLEALFQHVTPEQEAARATLEDGTIVRRYLRRRPVVLAMEMFETDVQTVLDEYLEGLIREEDFLKAARPWKNYASDYRPLVEFARLHAIPVVAGNAPGRYVSMVAREGAHSLRSLDEDVLRRLPELPLPAPTAAYAKSFAELMSSMEGHGSGDVGNLLDAQNFRDVTMAGRIEDALESHRGALVIHVNGAFHSNRRMGIPDHLDPNVEFLVVTFVPSDDLDTAPDEPLGDFIVLTQRMHDEDE